MIARMKKFYLFFEGNPSKVLRSLQREGLVEINMLPEKFGFEHHGILESDVEGKLNKISFLKNLVKKLEGKEPSGKILITEEQEKDILKKFSLDETYERFFLLSKESERREKIAKKLRVLKEELLLFRNLDLIPSDLFSMKTFSFCFFTVKTKQKKIPEGIEGLSLEKVGGDSTRFLFLVIFPKEIKEKVYRAIENFRGEIINIRRWNRKPCEIIKKIEEVYEKNKIILDSTNKKIKGILNLKYEILVFDDYINSILYYQKAKQTLRTSRFVTGCSGWIKERDVERFARVLKSIIPESYLHISAPDINKDEIPIALENNNIVNNFEVVTDLYGRPVYKNLDPTIHLSIFFVISFAFCITDAAYGLILIILALLSMRKFRFVPTIRKFLKLILYSGVATFAMGSITGGWFGNLLSRLPEGSFPVRALSKLVILDPLEGGNKTFLFLGWALTIGYIQILWGLALNLFNTAKQYGIKKSGEAFALLSIQMLVAIMIAFYAAIQKNKMPANVMKIPVLLLIVSFIYLMVTKAKTQKGAIMKIFWAFYGGYNVIAGNLLGDVLSYSRLFGLGLTTAVLGLVVNEMAFMATGIPIAGYILASLVFIIGHTGNLVINLLGGYVHTSRLQYLEFFTKFFESGGRPFNPLREIRNYTYLSKG